MIWMLIACQGSIDSENTSLSATLNGEGSLTTTTTTTMTAMEMIVMSAINGEYEPCG